MANYLTKYIDIRNQFVTLLNDFPKENIDIKYFKKWSLKDLLKHLIGWENYLVKAVESSKSNTEIEYFGNVNKFNEKSLKAMEEWSWDMVYMEYLKASKKLIEYFNFLSPEVLNKKIWKRRRYTPEKLLKIQINHYSKEHLPKLVRVMNSFKHF